MPKEYSVDDILNEVLGTPKKEPKPVEPEKEEIVVEVEKHRQENPVIDSTSAPTVIHVMDQKKEEEEKLREFVKNQIKESAKA